MPGLSIALADPLVVADTPANPVGLFPTKDSRLKIRIFALAKELDIDSKLLIDYCAKAGITIKNSALASISPEERDRVLDVMRSSGPSAAVATAPVAAPAVVASRDPVVDLAAKPRPIRVMGAKPPLMVPRSRVAEVEPPKAESVQAELPPVEEVEVETVPPVEVVEVAVTPKAVEIEETPAKEAAPKPAQSWQGGGYSSRRACRSESDCRTTCCCDASSRSARRGNA